MSERMQYEAIAEGGPECKNCGKALAYHHFDQSVPTYYCPVLPVDPDKERDRAVYEAEGFKFPAAALGIGYAEMAASYAGVEYTPALPDRPQRVTAPDILKRAAQHMEDRAVARDQPGGERSMTRTVDAFNALTGHAISERDGWMFMVVLKAARACTTATGLADDYDDMAAYSGLAGEAAQR